MNMYNNTLGGGMMMGGIYGGNFVDILFRELMLKGWQGITFMAIFNFYMYLSLDKIKDMLKHMNEWLANKIKMYMEIYGNEIINYVKSHGYYYVKNKLYKVIKIVKNLYKNNDKEVKEEVKEEDKSNKFVVTLNTENKIDLMALANYILLNRSKLYLIKNNERIKSDKYKAHEVYELPNFIEMSMDNINIEIKQNINFKMVCETDNKVELLKDVTYKVKKEYEKNITYEKFNKITEAILVDTEKLDFLRRRFSYIELDFGWDTDPRFMANGYFKFLWLVIYLSNNITYFRNFIEFLRKGKEICFNGREYVLSTSCDQLTEDFDTKLDDICKQMEVHIEKLSVRFKNRSDYEEMKKIIDVNIKFLEDAGEKKLNMEVIFKSEKVNHYDLSLYSRNFMKNMIKNYYQQDSSNIGDKISIYHLDIVKEIDIVKKENPKYKIWEEKYGEKVKKEKEKKKEKKENKEEENDKKEKKEEKKERDNDVKYGYNSDDYEMMYMGSPYSRTHYMKNYIPPKPEKIIEMEVEISKANCTLIKCDKKPMEYLYLQEEDKKLLSSYLKNFKTNRDLYERMGITYKGGILLSGVPGCGKSSTIVGIATYLNKDIYYINLGSIETNNELKICIDYVKVNSQKGGIIIFEDIDCMTDVVFQRKEELEKKKEEDKEEIKDKLSLSCLLNLLDGTMAPEDVIFIITTNHKDKLDTALIRPGRMDISIELRKCNKYQFGRIYEDMYGNPVPLEYLRRFKEYEFIVAEVIMHLFHNIHNKDMNIELLLEKFLIKN